MTRPVVVLTDDSIGAEARAVLAPHCEVRVLPGQYPSEAILAGAVGDADAILARLATVTSAVIENAPRLRIIARHGVGVDAVALEAATARGIIVTTTGAANAAAVAEYTFALLLGLLRHVPAADASMRSGAWSRTPLIGGELDGKTLGIIGLGSIGRRVARQGQGFGMHVVAADPMITEPRVAGAQMTSVEGLLATADVVSLHVRLAADTHRMIDTRAIALMKPSAVLVNTSRGEVIDEPALITALQQGRLAGAALDTFDLEPLGATSPLRGLRNVLLSPHVAGQTRESLARVGVMAAQSILDDLAGRRPPYVWNPEAYVRRGSASERIALDGPAQRGR